MSFVSYLCAASVLIQLLDVFLSLADLAFELQVDKEGLLNLVSLMCPDKSELCMYSIKIGPGSVSFPPHPCHNFNITLLRER